MRAGVADTPSRDLRADIYIYIYTQSEDKKVRMGLYAQDRHNL